MGWGARFGWCWSWRVGCGCMLFLGCRWGNGSIGAACMFPRGWFLHGVPGLSLIGIRGNLPVSSSLRAENILFPILPAPGVVKTTLLRNTCRCSRTQLQSSNPASHSSKPLFTELRHPFTLLQHPRYPQNPPPPPHSHHPQTPLH